MNFFASLIVNNVLYWILLSLITKEYLTPSVLIIHTYNYKQKHLNK